jgi:hypothetical protein
VTSHHSRISEEQRTAATTPPAQALVARRTVASANGQRRRLHPLTHLAFGGDVAKRCRFSAMAGSSGRVPAADAAAATDSYKAGHVLCSEILAANDEANRTDKMLL